VGKEAREEINEREEEEKEEEEEHEHTHMSHHMKMYNIKWMDEHILQLVSPQKSPS
jgi:hypothetical protein